MRSKLYILHGWSYDISKWSAFVESLKGFDLVILKIPGLTSTHLDQPWTLDDYAHWFHQQIKDESQVTVLAHSNGGRIIARFNKLYPNRISKLVLVDVAGIKSKNTLAQLKITSLAVLSKIAFPIKKITFFRKLLYKIIGETDYLNSSGHLKQTMINLISHDLASEYAQINAPTLIVWGDLDKTTPVSDGKLIHQLITNSKFELVSGAKHSPHITHPEQLSKLVKKFLNVA